MTTDEMTDQAFARTKFRRAREARGWTRPQPVARRNRLKDESYAEVLLLASVTVREPAMALGFSYGELAAYLAEFGSESLTTW